MKTKGHITTGHVGRAMGYALVTAFGLLALVLIHGAQREAAALTETTKHLEAAAIRAGY